MIKKIFMKYKKKRALPFLIFSVIKRRFLKKKHKLDEFLEDESKKFQKEYFYLKLYLSRRFNFFYYMTLKYYRRGFLFDDLLLWFEKYFTFPFYFYLKCITVYRTIQTHYSLKFWGFFYGLRRILYIVCFIPHGLSYLLPPMVFTKLSFYIHCYIVFFLFSLIADFLLTVYLILTAKKPNIRPKALSIGVTFFIIFGYAFLNLHFYSNLIFLEPNTLTNLYHLYSPFGRGYSINTYREKISIYLLIIELKSDFNCLVFVTPNRSVDSVLLDVYLKSNVCDEDLVWLDYYLNAKMDLFVNQFVNTLDKMDKLISIRIRYLKSCLGIR